MRVAATCRVVTAAGSVEEDGEAVEHGACGGPSSLSARR